MFYGWKIVGAAFVTLFISVGFLFYSFSAMFVALTAEFGGSRFASALALAIMNTSVGLFAPFLGHMLDTGSIRRLMMLGAASMAAGFFLASQAGSLWFLYIVFGTLLGMGASMVGQLPSSTLVANWFVRRRGTALGIATMGVSTSGVVMAPLAMWLIEHVGWRGTFVVFGLVAAGLVLPMVYWIVVCRPEDMGLAPDGLPPASGGGTAAAEPEWTARVALRDRNFWSITAVIACNFFSMGAILTHMIAHAIDLGVPELRAPFILSLSAAAGVAGKVVFGVIADRTGARPAFWLSIGIQICSTALLLVFQNAVALWIAAGFFGFGMGGIVPLWGSLVGEYFGRRSFGRIMGLMGPCMIPVQVTGVPFAGYIYDRFGSYTFAFITFIGFYAIAAGALLNLRETPDEANERMRSGYGAPVPEKSVCDAR